MDIQAFHDHPFHMYEGERLQDMVQSIKEHGVLNPVIVRNIDKGYEMLSGHNRANAAKLAGLTEVSTIVKAELSDKEAYVYVIETNLMQRSFNDLMPSKKAAVTAAHYDKVCLIIPASFGSSAIIRFSLASYSIVLPLTILCCIFRTWSFLSF